MSNNKELLFGISFSILTDLLTKLQGAGEVDQWFSKRAMGESEESTPVPSVPHSRGLRISRCMWMENYSILQFYTLEGGHSDVCNKIIDGKTEKLGVQVTKDWEALINTESYCKGRRVKKSWSFSWELKKIFLVKEVTEGQGGACSTQCSSFLPHPTLV